MVKWCMISKKNRGSRRRTERIRDKYVPWWETYFRSRAPRCWLKDQVTLRLFDRCISQNQGSDGRNPFYTFTFANVGAISRAHGTHGLRQFYWVMSAVVSLHASVLIQKGSWYCWIGVLDWPLSRAFSCTCPLFFLFSKLSQANMVSVHVLRINHLPAPIIPVNSA